MACRRPGAAAASLWIECPSGVCWHRSQRRPGKREISASIVCCWSLSRCQFGALSLPLSLTGLMRSFLCAGPASTDTTAHLGAEATDADYRGGWPFVSTLWKGFPMLLISGISNLIPHCLSSKQAWTFFLISTFLRDGNCRNHESKKTLIFRKKKL